MRDEPLEAVDDDVVADEEVRSSDFGAADEDFGAVNGGGDGEAFSGEDCLDFGAENEAVEVVEWIEAWNSVLLKEESERAGRTSANRGIGWSEDRDRSEPGDVRCVGERNGVSRHG